MTMRFLKSKALFQIVVIVLSVFSVYLFAVDDASAQASNVCCEKTRSDEFCQYTLREQCESNYGIFPGRCSQAAFCKPVCCRDTSSGECFNNVGVSACLSAANRTYVDGSCSGVQECRRGCCQIGNQCFLANENNCNVRARTLNTHASFEAGITNELDCVNQCRRQEEGCCISREGCTFMTRGECSTARSTRNDGTQGFYKDIFCSDPSLNCRQCKAKARKGCVPGEDDVHWFDSCGNKEEKAEDCDYGRGTICKERNGRASCQSVHCSDTEDFPKNTHDLQMGSFRKNGESWCTYEGRVGPSYDLVGSRHYRRMCVNGEELVEPCKDLREEMCLQGFVDNIEFSFASCVKNDGVDCVTKCNKKDDMRGNKQCCERHPTCFWAADNAGNGKCIPVVPPGLRFWGETNSRTGESGTDAKEVCDKGDITCKSVWRKTLSSGWKCVRNCVCEKEEWPVSVNKFCRSLGDCGSHYNVVGAFTSVGQRTSGSRTKQLDSDLLEQFSFFEQSGVLLLFNVTREYQQFAERGFAGTHRGYAWIDILIEDPQKAIIPYIYKVLGGRNIVSQIVAYVASAFIFLLDILEWTFLRWWLGIGDTKKYTHRFNCEPWIAPTGGSNCEKCDDDPRFECSEYKCKSLGAGCKLINEGTKQVACVDTNPNDVNAPVIQPWREVLTRGFIVNPTQTGYAISPMAPAFTRITFGVKLNEHAQCKLDDKHTNGYDEMASFFGSERYGKEKNVTMSLQGGQDYTFYIRCSDTRGNKNLNEYTIQVSSSREPDLTAPMIVETSIENGAFVPYGVNETVATFYLNEPSTCRWSKMDQDYGMMPENNTMLCNELSEGIPLYLETFDCDALLPLRDDTNNQFYIRCADLVNNINQQSYVYSLKGTKPLTVQSAEPSGVLVSGAVNLRVVTGNGAEQGKATCGFSGTDVPRRIEFMQTGSSTHAQPLNLTLGNYNYIVDCADAAGNAANATLSFSVELAAALGAPRIVNMFSTSRTSLTIVTDRASTCRYSKTQATFNFEDGILMSGLNVREHSMDEYSPVYYIKCKDEEGNMSEAITVYR